MKTKFILTFIFGTIMIIAAVGAWFMDFISKDVLAGAIVTIVLPCGMVLAYLNFLLTHKAKEAVKNAVLTDATGYRENVSVIEAPMPEPFSTKTRTEKVERSFHAV